METPRDDMDTLLQERLEQIEAGLPLEACLNDLPEDAVTELQLAAQLRQMPLPEMGETAVINQRAAVMRQAMRQPATAPQTWLARLLAWLRGNQAVAWKATAVAMTLLLLLAAGLLLRNRATAPVANIEAAPEADTETAAAEEPSGPSLLDRLFGRSEDVEEADIAAPPPQAVATAVAVAPEADLGFTTFLPFLTDPLQTSPQTAVLGDLQGAVSVNSGDGSWTAVNNLQSLAVGDRVQTGPFSGATLTFYDGSQAQIGPDSELSIDQLNALRPEVGFRTVVLTQWRGDSVHEVQFRNDSGSRYEVKSPSGSGIARGTTFKVSVLPDLTSRYLVMKGRVDVISVNVTVSVLAGQITTILAGTPPAAPRFQVNGQGEVTGIGATWAIGGQTFNTTDQTVIVGNPQVGDWVSVSGYLLPDGSRVADLITLLRRLPQNEFSLTATVTEIDGAAWVIGGQTIVVDADTAVDPAIETGDLVRVTGVVQADGTFLAQHIQQLDRNEGYPFEFTGVVQSVADDEWLISGIAVQVNGRTEIKGNLTVGDLVKVEGQITPDGLWLAREIKAEDSDDGVKFEFSGTVEATAPWRVAGIVLATEAWTEIDAGIGIGDIVRVEGVILTDGTWLAEEIKLRHDDSHNEIRIRFTGTVSSIDPWVVNGLTFILTDNSQIAPDITVGDVVQVAARLAESGEWELVWIRPLRSPTAGCFTVYARIITVNGSQITLTNWPSLTLNDDVLVEGTLAPNSIISVNICGAENDTVVVINIIVIQVVVEITPNFDNNDNNNGDGHHDDDDDDDDDDHDDDDDD